MLEPLDTLPSVGGPMDYNQIIRNALMPVNPLLAMQPPALNTGTPLIPENTLRDAVARALSPVKPQPTDDDRMSALGRIGQALLKPRMPGQSVAGQFGDAAATGSQYLDAQRDKAAAENMQRATFATQAASADAARRTAETNLQMMAQKYPVEFAELQQRLRKSTLEGNVQEVEAIKAHLMKANGGEFIAQQIAADMRKRTAEATKLEAEAKRVPAQAEEDRARAEYLRAQAQVLIPAHAEAYRGLNKPDAFKVIDKDRGLVAVTKPGGGEDYFIVDAPMSPQEAMTRAKKELTEEKRAQHKAAGGTFDMFAPSPTQQEINERAQQYVRGGVRQLGSSGTERTGKPMPAPTAPTPAAPNASSGPVPGPASKALPAERTRAITALQSDIARLQSDLTTAKTLAEKTEIQAAINNAQNQLNELQGGGPKPSDTSGSNLQPVGNFPGKPGAAQIDISKNPGAPGSIVFERDANGNIVRQGAKPTPASAATTKQVPEAVSSEGMRVDDLREQVSQLKNRLMTYGVARRKQDPKGFDDLRANLRAAQLALAEAEDAYEKSVGAQKAVTGRTYSK